MRIDFPSWHVSAVSNARRHVGNWGMSGLEPHIAISVLPRRRHKDRANIPRSKAFVERLRELGSIEGRAVAIECQ